MSTLQTPMPPDFARARYNMIESQLRPNKVRNEWILTAMGSIPRELFVPENLEGIAYIDEDLPVAAGRYLMEPMVLARMLEEAGINPNDRVLDIGAATGYSTAVIASIAKSVVALESDGMLQGDIEHNIGQLGFRNVQTCLGKLNEGVEASGPYDLIFVNGCVDYVPEVFLDQLAEGGRLVAVVRGFGPGHAAHVSEARLYVRRRDNISHRALFDANIKPLPGMQLRPGFDF